MMGARLKRNCKMCKKRSNLSFDPEKLLCAECLLIWRDNVVREHKGGKITFQKAYESILKRCRMNEEEVLDLVFPPIGVDDFQSDSMALKMNFDIDVVKQLEEAENDRKNRQE